MSNATITEVDRATARRVIRRHVGAEDHGRTEETILGRNRVAILEGWRVIVDIEALDAACLAAAQGRAYAAALRGAR